MSLLLTGAPLLLHSGMDFDWSYPSLLALTAIVGALLGRPVAFMPKRASVTSAAWGVGSMMMLGLAAVAAWNGVLDLNVSIVGAS